MPSPMKSAAEFDGVDASMIDCMKASIVDTLNLMGRATP